MSTFSSEPGSTVPLQPMPIRTESVEALSDEDSNSDTDESPTDEYDPWEPPRPRPHPSLDQLTCSVQYMRKYMIQIRDFLADARATNIIVPDRTSTETHIQFYRIYDRLSTVLRKDSVARFLSIFQKYTDSFVCGFVITPQTLDLIIAQNALRCVKLVLEGKSPKLWGQRANPNYITSFGYFPLHQAAESFSVDMIELLLRHGASANQRTSGDRIVEGLLPLHVAIENTCQHKYLEDNLLADQNYWKGNVEYIYKLVHLLCLPEMKIFLDTTRLLATHTDSVVDELWNYIKQGKLVPAAILLLAAQKQFRNLNGFDMIKDRIEDYMVTLAREGFGVESGKNAKAKKHLKEMKVQLINALLLVKIILKAGEALDGYIQTHSEASHQEVLEKVSAVLQNYDVGPTGREICIEELNCCPYDCGRPDGVLDEHGNTDLTKAAIGSPTLEAAGKKAVTKGPHDSHWYARDRFFPVWRSVLTSQFITTVIPPYAPKKELPQYMRDADDRVPGSSQKKMIDERHPQIRLGMLERSYPGVKSNRNLPSNRRSRRLFGTAASTVLKMLKRWASSSSTEGISFPPRSTQSATPRQKAGPPPLIAFLTSSLPPLAHLLHLYLEGHHAGTHLSSPGSHGVLTDLGAAAASGAGGGPVGAGVLARLRRRHAQAAGGHGGRRHGRGAELHAAAGHRGRDALRHRALLPAALRHRLRAPLHLHPEEPALDPARLPLHGHRRRPHRRQARPARPARRVHRGRLHPGRHRRHHAPARGARRLRVHAPLHHPRGRHDGRQRHDRHGRHHEEAPRGRQVPAEPRGDGAGAGRDAAAGDGGAGAAVAGARAVAGDRQRQDGGADLAAGGHDGAHHGGRVAAGGHPAADRGDEHAHGGVHRQQHPLHLPLLAGLLHQHLPARRLCFHRLGLGQTSKK